MLHDIDIDSRHRALHVMRMLRPQQMEGAKKVRVGRMFDGGYVMLDRFEGVTAVYSLGINDDTSFDMDFARRDIPIYQYDHTIERLPATHDHFHWHKTAIGGAVDDAANIITIAEAVARNGHAGNSNMILKCDIEESEWVALRVTPSSVLRQFRQIVVEIHNFGYLGHPQHAEGVRETIEQLTACHRVVHVHGNNHAPMYVIGGLPIPAVLELTLVRADEGTFIPSNERFPTPLDMPCRCDKADLYLGDFDFS